MSVRPRSQRPAAERKKAEQFVQRAYLDGIKLKAAMIVIHRVSRAMEPGPFAVASEPELKEALRLLRVFAEAHPLPKSLEDL